MWLKASFINFNSTIIRWYIKTFWNYSHISLNIRNYIKLIQSTKQTFPNFAIMFKRRSMQGEIWRHRLMTSCNSSLVRKFMEIFLSKIETMTNTVWQVLFLDYIGTNNSINMQFWNFLNSLVTEWECRFWDNACRLTSQTMRIIYGGDRLNNCILNSRHLSYFLAFSRYNVQYRVTICCK